MARRKTKEQEYINNLEDRVKSLYSKVRRNVHYCKEGRQGEIDFMGKISGNGWDLYEVKSTNRHKSLKTAREQLDRAKDYAPYTVHDLYIYIGRDDELISGD